MSKTPDQLFTEYEVAARRMPWHLRWWYLRKARKARREWDERLDRELRRVLHAERGQ